MCVKPLLRARPALLWEKMEGQTHPLGRELGIHCGWVEGRRIEVCRAMGTEHRPLAHSESSRKAAWRR